MNYSYRTGRAVPKVEAQDVGNELERINSKYGTLIPAKVVDESKPKAAVLHDQFEWNDKTAAVEYRIHQARQIISSVCIVPETEGKKPVQAFINVRVVDEGDTEEAENRGRAYVPASEVASNDNFKTQHLESIKSRLKNMRREYAAFLELAEVWEAVDTLA